MALAVVSGVTLNTTNGQVTISPAPLVGDTITAGFEFDIPARFNSPIEVTALAKDARDCGANRTDRTAAAMKAAVAD